jgi:hypothetical protein
LITTWSPWLEQKRLVISGMLLSGPAHALKVGVARIGPVVGLAQPGDAALPHPELGAGLVGAVSKMLP